MKIGRGAGGLQGARLGIVALSVLAVATGATVVMALGVLGGIASALILEFVDDPIRTRTDVMARLGVACLGEIPCVSGKIPLSEAFEDTRSNVSEAYSAVLAALHFRNAGGAPEALLVTSVFSGEGKSSSALALSQNFARRGERVLLIDADLRRPAFGAALAEQGLSELLVSGESICPHVVKTRHENLWLLPSGAMAPNPADLLASEQFETILAEAKGNFDRVIVDGPPTLGLADVTFLAAPIGAVMMVIESGGTRSRCAREAIERITSSGARLVGVTITKSTGKASRDGLVDDSRAAPKNGELNLILLGAVL